MVLSVLAERSQIRIRSLQQDLPKMPAADWRSTFRRGRSTRSCIDSRSDKLIRCKWDASTGRRRKWYELTEPGRKRLTVQAREWHAYAGVLRKVPCGA